MHQYRPFTHSELFRNKIVLCFPAVILQVSEAGVHRPHVGGIHGRSNDGSYSLVLAGGFEDEVVHCSHTLSLSHTLALSVSLSHKLHCHCFSYHHFSLFILSSRLFLSVGRFFCSPPHLIQSSSHCSCMSFSLGMY